MREKQQDMRYRRTKRNLRKALIVLLSEKNIDAISVRELAEKADINRATFYLHYESPRAMLLSLENQLYDTIMSAYQNNAVSNPAAFFETVYRCLLDHAELSGVLLHQNNVHGFWEKLGCALRDEYTTHFLPEHPPYAQTDLQYYLAFVKDGYISIVKQWILSGMKESPDYMVSISQRFLKHIRIDRLLQ